VIEGEGKVGGRISDLIAGVETKTPLRHQIKSFGSERGGVERERERGKGPKSNNGGGGW